MFEYPNNDRQKHSFILIVCKLTEVGLNNIIYIQLIYFKYNYNVI